MKIVVFAFHRMTYALKKKPALNRAGTTFCSYGFVQFFFLIYFMIDFFNQLKFRKKFL